MDSIHFSLLERYATSLPDSISFFVGWNYVYAIPYLAFLYAMLNCRIYHWFAFVSFPIGIMTIVVVVSINTTLADYIVLGINATISAMLFWFTGINKTWRESLTQPEEIKDATENLVHLIQAVDLDSNLKLWLRALLQLPKSERQLEICACLDMMRDRHGPKELRQALSLLADDYIAKRVSGMLAG